jgi:hypothetical protein
MQFFQYVFVCPNQLADFKRVALNAVPLKAVASSHSLISYNL